MREVGNLVRQIQLDPASGRPPVPLVIVYREKRRRSRVAALFDFFL
jgi:hypothetical protein